MVTTNGHAEVILEEPRVSEDSLIGLRERNFSWAGSVYAAPDTASAPRIPLADISHVAIKKTDVGTSIAVGLGVVAAATAFVGLVGMIIFLSSWQQPS